MFHQPLRKSCWVREDIFHNLDPSRKKWIACETIAISSYEGEMVSFIINQNGFLFYNVPLHLINFGQTQPKDCTEGRLEESACNCGMGEFSKTDLFPKSTIVWAKNLTGIYEKTSYLTTLEWSSVENLNLHILIDAQGFLQAKENPQVCFSETYPVKEPQWKTLRHTFKIK